jgi:hydroxyquinol 1,2-dioxygenase
MIIRHQLEVTEAVLAALKGAPDPRFRGIMGAAVRHLHGFARDARLTEDEFQQACAWVARLGRLTDAGHDEVGLMAGVLGLSSLVCLLNHGDQGQTDTTAHLMDPFWRTDSPRTDNGGSIVRSPTPGTPIFVNAWVRDRQGRPVAGAEVDVWHSSPEGLYDVQDPAQADMNLRGKFCSDAAGRIAFRSVKPVGYAIPTTGVVGELLRTLGRAPMRPAHIHFMIHKPGFKTQFSQVFASDDPQLQDDVQFAVTQAQIGQYVLHDGEAAPAADVRGPWVSLDHHFVLEAGESRLPEPPRHALRAGR